MNQTTSNVLMQPRADAVERLTLIEKLELEKECWHDDGENNAHRIIDDCIDIVKQHQAESGWISVDERLPMGNLIVFTYSTCWIVSKAMFIIYAERYAIGRMTYVPSEVNNIILKYLPFIANNTLGIS